MFPRDSESMKKAKLTLGLLLALLGVAVTVIGGILKPGSVLPYSNWKARNAPSHLAWMGGLAVCTAGILLILREILRWTPDERETIALRKEILITLSLNGVSQQQLNEIISSRYSKTGLLSLNIAELKEILALLEPTLSASNTLHRDTSNKWSDASRGSVSRMKLL